MIVNMSKYSFLVYHKEYDNFLIQMRELGVLHVIKKQSGAPVEGGDLQDKLQEAARFDKALKFISANLGGDYSKCTSKDQSQDGIGRVAHLENLIEQNTKDQQKEINIQKEIDKMELWGKFEWNDIYRLKDAGLIVRFWSVNERNFLAEWESKYNAFRINQIGSQQLFITITKQGELPELENAERVRLPKESLSELIAQRTEIKEEQENTLNEIDSFCIAEYSLIEKSYRLLLEQIDYDNVILNSEGHANNMVYLLEGWVPTVDEAKVNEYLDKNGIYYTHEKAKKDDPAPVQLTNNKFARLFHPITELYDLPAYGERDLTPFFAPFFVMFFGLCLGDAGYGILLLLIGLIARRKVKPSLKPMMSLVAILGVGTMIFGTISGTLFGIELIKVDWPWIKSLKNIMLNSNQLFYFSLIVGVVQIVFAMILKAVGQTQRFGFKNALSAWGWLIALVGCGGAFALSSFGYITESTAKIIYYIAGGVGALGIFLFNNIKRNPIINIGSGLWDSYNMASGLLGDILSYVRLFALGISGSVLGLVFNDLAVQMSPDIPVVGFLVSIPILLFGHGINIFMSGLGAFVHPMRLTFVEFYKNAGFEGGGKKYKPFSHIKKED
ncbi:MAG: V-type ATPase 116kDa subunit family protein [Bacteroidales bacterium]|nr:V-type ATPase 116kDa subunit family protein [Bacteroidales bacterium]